MKMPQHAMRARAPVLLALALAALGAAAAPASPVDSAAGTVSGRVPGPVNRIGFALGTLHMAMRDDVVSPLKWAGPGGTLGFGYWRLGATSRHSVELSAPLGLLNNRYGHRAGALGLRVGYIYLRPLAAFGGRGTTFLGGCLQRDSDLYLYADWDDEHLYWITTYDIAAAVRHEVQLRNGHNLELQAVLPVVSLVSRPPRYRYYKIDDFKNPGFYLTKPQENLRVTALGELVSLDISVSYGFALAGSWAFRAQYGFYYRRYTRPETIVERSSVFSLRVTHDL